MIKWLWKPIYRKGKIIHYELRDNHDEIKDIKGKTAYKVIWTCDNKDCKFPNKTHSLSACHLRKEKMSVDLQICRPCQCSGSGNGRYNDKRTWDELMGVEKSFLLKKQFRENFINNNPSHLPEVKIKKKQTIITEKTLPQIIKDFNFELIDIIELKGKNSIFNVKCPQGHVLTKTYSNFVRNKKYRCEKCFYNDISIHLTDEEIKKIENYYRQVRSLTAKTYRIYKYFINPNNLEIGRKKNHLDHKFSIYEGFKHNVDIKIISSKENLQILSESENCSKQNKCDISLSELFEKTAYLFKK